MPLGPHVPAWKALREALDALVKAAAPATLAAVIDERGLLWCWSTPSPPLSDRWGAVVKLSDAVHAKEIARRSPRLSQGAHLSAVRLNDEAPKKKGHLTVLSGGALRWKAYIVESFASYYVLVVWFDDATAIASQHDVVRAAVQKVMGLTTALPPPDGPTTSAGARRVPLRR